MRQKSALFVLGSLLSCSLLSAAGLEMANATVGSNLQTFVTFKLSEPAPEGGLEVTLTSEDPKLLRLSNRPDVPGMPSMTMTVRPGFTESQDVYLHAFGSKGTVGYTATAKGMTKARGVVTLTPSSIVMVGPYKASKFRTTTGAALPRLALYSVRLTPEGEYAEQQAVAGGLDLELVLSSTKAEVGVVDPKKVYMAGGTPNTIADFKPGKPGVTMISVAMPPGFNPPPAKYPPVEATVALPGLALTESVMIGENLQIGANVGLGESAGPQGVEVTITSDDPTKLLVAAKPTDPGAKSVTIKVGPNGFSTSFYLQALAKSGTVSYTASAPGFAPRAAKVGLAPSGVVIAPKPYGPPDEAELFRKSGEGNRGFVSHLERKVKMPLAVWTAQLDPVTLRSADITVQPLRAGMTIVVNVESSNPEAGSVISPVKIEGGHEMGSSEFTPLKAGETLITAITPAGFTKSANSTSVQAIVK